MLAFRNAPDYEDPKGGASGNSNLYEVTIVASDDDNVGMRSVTVKVDNIEEDGEVSLSVRKPEIGMPITATLEDPDEGVMGVSWQWARQVAGGGGQCPATGTVNWDDIADETSMTYTPGDDDVPTATAEQVLASDGDVR